MKKHIIIIMLIPLMLMASCVQEDSFEDTPEGNFEALWKILDEHYCFFDYKASQYGLDWNAVYKKYSAQTSPTLSSEQLFEVLCNMLAELKDGHVNISSSYDFGRYWNWYEDYPSNYSDSITRKYLGNDYKLASGLKYTILDDNIGYITCDLS